MEGSFKRPKALMCYICGREFGTASLGIHQKQCAQLWEDREKLKPKNLRRPLPTPPTEVPIGTSTKSIEAHNEVVSQAFEKNVMKSCPNCNRTFLEDRLAIHLRSCTQDKPARQVGHVGSSPAPPNPNPPRQVKKMASPPPQKKVSSPESPQKSTINSQGRNPQIQGGRVPNRPTNIQSEAKPSTESKVKTANIQPEVSRIEAKPRPTNTQSEPQASTESKPKVFCPYCGERYVPNAKFCSECGERKI